jgi:hypothetical protein
MGWNLSGRFFVVPKEIPLVEAQLSYKKKNPVCYTKGIQGPFRAWRPFV